MALDAAAPRVTSEASIFPAPTLVRVAWAYAKAEQESPTVFEALAAAATARVAAEPDAFSPPDLALLAWAFAKARCASKD